MRTRSIALLLLVTVAACFAKPERVDPNADAARVDAPVGACRAPACAAAGGGCEDGICVILQDEDDATTCPDGMPCRIECIADNACKMGVDCGNATSCEVRCTSNSSCKDKGVDCGSAETCTVTCIGMNACQKGEMGGAAVECRTAECTVTCDGPGACEDGIDVDPGGTCAAHCCGGGCPAPVVDPACSRDMTCG